MLFLVKVEGESLWPELIPGKRYLAFSFGKPSVADYLVFKNPTDPKTIFVKKVTAVSDDSYEVAGTVPWAHSSKDFGKVPKSLVLGTLLFPSLIRF